MSSPVTWQWDSVRLSRYYWSSLERCWIYQDGQRVYPPFTYSLEPSRVMQQVEEPQVVHNYLRNGQQHLNSSHRYGSATTSYAHPSLPYYPAAQQQLVPYTASQSGTRTTGIGSRTKDVASLIETGPAEVITDPALLKLGILASWKFKGSPGDGEEPNPGYRVRRPGYKFFRVGKVFKLLGPEPEGFDATETIGSDYSDESFSNRLCWFVVVQEGDDLCSCLRIQTYHLRGVAEQGFVKRHHAIIHTRRNPPDPRPDELPREGEYGMMNPIRVRSRSIAYKLNPSARVNFGKVYTVEHNVKVYDFGDVHDDSLQAFTGQFDSVWGIERNTDSKRRSRKGDSLFGAWRTHKNEEERGDRTKRKKAASSAKAKTGDKGKPLDGQSLLEPAPRIPVNDYYSEIFKDEYFDDVDDDHIGEQEEMAEAEEPKDEAGQTILDLMDSWDVEDQHFDFSTEAFSDSSDGPAASSDRPLTDFHSLAGKSTPPSWKEEPYEPPQRQRPWARAAARDQALREERQRQRAADNTRRQQAEVDRLADELSKKLPENERRERGEELLENLAQARFAAREAARAARAAARARRGVGVWGPIVENPLLKLAEDQQRSRLAQLKAELTETDAQSSKTCEDIRQNKPVQEQGTALVKAKRNYVDEVKAWQQEILGTQATQGTVSSGEREREQIRQEALDEEREQMRRERQDPEAREVRERAKILQAKRMERLDRFRRMVRESIRRLHGADADRRERADVESSHTQIPEINNEGNKSTPAPCDPSNSPEHSFKSADTLPSLGSLTDSSPDLASVVSADVSDSGTEDERHNRMPLPLELGEDIRFVNPSQWQSDLKELEADVVRGSQLGAYSNEEWPYRIESNNLFSHIRHARRVTEGVLRNFDVMSKKNYCGDSINSLVVDCTRDTVASLRSISEVRIQYLLQLLLSLEKTYPSQHDSSQVHEVPLNLQFTDNFGSGQVLDRPRECPEGLVHPERLDGDEVNVEGQTAPSYVHENGVSKQLLDLLEESLAFLESFGLKTAVCDRALDIQALQRRLSKELLELTTCYAIEALCSILDLAVVSFSGAHLEPFDERYLGCTQKVFKVPCDGQGSIVLFRRRSLKCLSGYFHDQGVWSFEIAKTGSTADIDSPTVLSMSEAPLYLSATIEEFANVWGPAWAVVSPDQPDVVIRFNIGVGFVVPWPRMDNEPSVESDEVFCHWTIEEDEIPDDLTFPQGKGYRLLIGAVPRLSRNKECSASPREFTRSMREKNRLGDLGTTRHSKERDSQTVSMGINVFGAQVGYQEQYKRRTGTLLKESLLAAWINEPERRNPRTMLHWFGVEISACTHNARRRRLTRILGSATIHNYLRSIVMDWSDPECERQYFDALNDPNKYAFEDLYIQRKSWRKELGQAVALSLKALLKTGTDQKHRLSAVWAPFAHDEVWMATFPYSSYCWAGLLSDTVDSCTVAIVTQDCLEFRRSRWPALCQSVRCGNCPTYPRDLSYMDQSGKGKQRCDVPLYGWHATNPSQQQYSCLLSEEHYGACDNRTFNHHSLLETSVVINNTAKFPEGLTWETGSGLVLAKDSEFDLGGSGRLKVLTQYERCVLVEWKEPGMFSQVKASFRENIQKSTRSPCHWELVRDCLHTSVSIPVHITSNPKFVA